MQRQLPNSTMEKVSFAARLRLLCFAFFACRSENHSIPLLSCLTHCPACPPASKPKHSAHSLHPDGHFSSWPLALNQRSIMSLPRYLHLCIIRIAQHVHTMPHCAVCCCTCVLMCNSEMPMHRACACMPMPAVLPPPQVRPTDPAYREGVQTSPPAQTSQG